MQYEAPLQFEAKRDQLLGQLSSWPSLAVAFSGGVDSSVLLHAAHGALGANAVGVIADSPSLPRRELALARRVAHQIGAVLEVVSTAELEDARYVANAGDRCYFCKSALFDAMDLVRARRGIERCAFGEIVDDASDDRPGARAARERGVRAPLADAGFTKDDVRRYAELVGLEVAHKPASACLASRIPVGTQVTREGLAQVERAEADLAALGLRVLRVRHLGRGARLEVGPDELVWARANAGPVEACLERAGFAEWELVPYVTPGNRGPEAPLDLPIARP